MKVLDHEPYVWFLLEDDGALHLDALCSHSFFDYRVLIALNDAELSAYRAKGRDALTRLASDIHYSAPGVAGSRSPFKARNLTIGPGDHGDRADAAIDAWLAAHPEA